MKKVLLASFLLLLILFPNYLNVEGAIIGDLNWKDGSTDLKISLGESASFDFTAYSIRPPLTIKVELLDLNNNVIHTYDDTTLDSNNNFYANSYEITDKHYINQGEYVIRAFTTDSRNDFQTRYIYLTVIDNQPPVIQPIGAKTVNENNNLQFPVIISDSDGDPLTLSHSTLPNGATFNSNTNVFSWTPSFDFIGHTGLPLTKDFDVLFTVSDGTSITEELVTITINDVNRNPILTTITDVIILADQSPVSLDLKNFAVDEDKDVVTWSTTGGTKINVNIDPNNIAVFTPNQGFTGQEIIPLTASDGFGGLVSTTVNVISDETNHPPEITSNAITNAVVNKLYKYKVVAIDQDQDPLTYSLDQAPHGMIINNNGLITWTPTNIGLVDVIVSVSDQHASAKQSYTISVTIEPQGNNPPIIITSPVRNAVANQLYIYDVDATDADGDSLIYNLNFNPSGMNINTFTGVISWTPTLTQLGNHNVQIAVSDSTHTTTQFYELRVSSKNIQSGDKHKFSLNNLIISQNSKYLEVFANLRNLGNQEEDIKLTVTVDGTQVKGDLTIDINDSRWKILRMQNLSPGTYTIKVEATSKDDRDVLYRTITIN